MKTPSSDKPSPYHQQAKLRRNSSKSTRSSLVADGDPEHKKMVIQDMQSFVFNEDMKRIRKAEKVILNAEEQFGALSRDPHGRLVPLLQVSALYLVFIVDAS